MAEEKKYLVLNGAERYVSSYVESGRVINHGEVISCGPMMSARLKSNMRKDPRTNEPASYFRDATAAEIDAYIHRLDNIDPTTGDPSLVGEAARLEAQRMGKVERSEAKEIERRDDVAEELQPQKARRRRGSKSED